jgi:Protein of unknown function (DUF664)
MVARTQLADPAETVAAFERECAASREVVAQARSLEFLSKQPSRRTGQPWSLRWIVSHMIEEYARHNGHADLLRERVDGQTGYYKEASCAQAVLPATPHGRVRVALLSSLPTPPMPSPIPDDPACAYARRPPVWRC